MTTAISDTCPSQHAHGQHLWTDPETLTRYICPGHFPVQPAANPERTTL